MDKEIQNSFVLENSFNGMIDKMDVVKHLNVSVKTSERILSRNNILHTNSSNIEKLQLYISGVPTSEIADKFSVSEVSINALAKRKGIVRPIGFLNKIPFDYCFFDNIDSEEKAYILGFLYADGHVSDKEIKISIKDIDIDILEKIKISLNGDFNIRKNFISNSFGNCKIVTISFSNSHTINSLRNIGVSKNKTVECRFPDIKKPFLKDFIRGYMDGDGSFSRYTSNDGYTKYSVSFQGTHEFLEGLKESIISNNFFVNQNFSKRFDTENCCYSLSMSGKNNVMDFLDWLYSDSKIYLNRKFNKFLSLKE